MCGMQSIVRASLLCLALSAPVLARAACSRSILVPVSNIGQAVIVNGTTVSGVYPDALRNLGAKAGCTFNFVDYPRARSDDMFFERGTSDMVIPASYVPERAKVATFVPLIKVLPMWITIKDGPGHITSVQELLLNKAVRGVVVRSFTFGTEYQSLIAELGKEGRIDLVPDLQTVARMLLAKRADFTILPPHLMQTAMQAEALKLGTRIPLHSNALEGLPRVDSGVYISRRSLSVADHDVLVAMFKRAAKSGEFLKSHHNYYPSEVLHNIVTLP